MNFVARTVLFFVLAGMVNFSTTCCCGESVFCEFIRGGCDKHPDGDCKHGPTHHGQWGHRCYKASGDAPIPAQSLDGDPDGTRVACCAPGTVQVPPAGPTAEVMTGRGPPPGDRLRSLASRGSWLL